MVDDSQRTDALVAETEDAHRFFLESSIFNFTQDVGSSLLIDRYRERHNNQFVLIDGLDSSQTGSGERLQVEESGTNLVLDGTDANSSDVNENVLFEKS